MLVAVSTNNEFFSGLIRTKLESQIRMDILQLDCELVEKFFPLGFIVGLESEQLFLVPNEPVPKLLLRRHF